MYGGTSAAPQVCPGESNCEKWAGSAGRRAAKERAVCHPCPMFGTKTGSGKHNHKYLTDLVTRSMHLRTLRIAGYPAELWEMTAVEFQCLIMIEQMIEEREIELKTETTEMLTAVLKGGR